MVREGLIVSFCCLCVITGCTEGRVKHNEGSFVQINVELPPGLEKRIIEYWDAYNGERWGEVYDISLAMQGFWAAEGKAGGRRGFVKWCEENMESIEGTATIVRCETPSKGIAVATLETTINGKEGVQQETWIKRWGKWYLRILVPADE